MVLTLHRYFYEFRGGSGRTAIAQMCDARGAGYDHFPPGSRKDLLTGLDILMHVVFSDHFFSAVMTTANGAEHTDESAFGRDLGISLEGLRYIGDRSDANECNRFRRTHNCVNDGLDAVIMNGSRIIF